MEFIDHTGHIFSINSFNEKPIGYEYNINDYVFWLEDEYTNKLSVNNYYIKPIRILLDKKYLAELAGVEDYTTYDMNTFNLTIECESQVFSLIGGRYINDFYNTKNPFYNLLTEYGKQILYTQDLKYIDNLSAENETEGNYICVPFYVIGKTSEEGTWTTNILITVNYKEYCVISVGGVFYDETEELYINGKNMGIELPKDVLRAVYQNSFYNVNLNEPLYYEKLKELLINYMPIISECGNYNSVINSLKWFGWGKNISVVKLLQTDNDFINQYILDYFDINDDTINSFKKFKNSTYISLLVKENQELDEEYLQNFNNDFWGEGKPKFQNLFDLYTKVTYDETKLPFYKSYYDFCFDELGLKLCALKYYYEQIFLPIHLKIHNASITHQVFINDNKLIVKPANQKIIEDSLFTSTLKDLVEFDSKIYYLSIPTGKNNRDINHYYFDDKFNSFNNTGQIGAEYNEAIYYTNNLCVKIPIEFKHKVFFDVYYDNNNNVWRKIIDKTPYYGYIANKKSYKEEITNKKKISTLLDSPFYDFSIDTDISLTSTKLYIDDDNNYYFSNTENIIHKSGVGFEYVKYDDNYIYNVVLILKRNNTIIHESKFSFCQSSYDASYNSFIIDPKYISSYITDKINYWVDQSYELLLNVNGKWFNHKFVIKLPQTNIETGKLVYKYNLEYKSYSPLEVDGKIIYQEYIGHITPFAQICNILETKKLNTDGKNIEFINTSIINNCNFDINDVLIGQHSKLIDNTISSLRFMGYMHEPDLVRVNDIDFSNKLLSLKDDAYRNNKILNLIKKEYTETPNIHIDDSLLNKVYYYDIYRRPHKYIKSLNYNGVTNETKKFEIKEFVRYDYITLPNFSISFDVYNGSQGKSDITLFENITADTHSKFKLYLKKSDNLLLTINDKTTYDLTKLFTGEVNINSQTEHFSISISPTLYYLSKPTPPATTIVPSTTVRPISQWYTCVISAKNKKEDDYVIFITSKQFYDSENLVEWINTNIEHCKEFEDNKFISYETIDNNDIKINEYCGEIDRTIPSYVTSKPTLKPEATEYTCIIYCKNTTEEQYIVYKTSKQFSNNEVGINQLKDFITNNIAVCEEEYNYILWETQDNYYCIIPEYSGEIHDKIIVTSTPTITPISTSTPIVTKKPVSSYKTYKITIHNYIDDTENTKILTPLDFINIPDDVPEILPFKPEESKYTDLYNNFMFSLIKCELVNNVNLKNITIKYDEHELNTWEKINWKIDKNSTNIDINNIDINGSINLFKTFYTKHELQQKDISGLTHIFNQYKNNIQLNGEFLYDMYLMRDTDGYYYSVFISEQSLADKIDSQIKTDATTIYYIPTSYNTIEDLLDSDKVIYYDDITNEDYEYKLVKFNEDKKFLLNRMYVQPANGINQYNKKDIIVCYLNNYDNTEFKYDFGTKWHITPYSLGITNEFEANSNTNICIISMLNNNSQHISGYYTVSCRYSLDKYQLHQYIKKAKILIKK